MYKYNGFSGNYSIIKRIANLLSSGTAIAFMFRFMMLIFLCAALHGCTGQMKFDKDKWREGDAGVYPYRDAMLKDLLNYPLQGMTYKELTDLAGEPNRWESNIDSPYYDIITRYGLDIDPVYSKTLTIYLNRDSVITGYRIVEWKK